MEQVWSHEITVADPEQMHELGIKLASNLRAGDLVVLTGELGAGKTTLSRGIGEGLGVRGPVTSPTFVLARTHPSLIKGPALVHVDAYRLHDATEFDDLDIDFASAVVLVEWGKDKVQLKEDWLEIVIDRPKGNEEIDFDSESEPRTLTLYAFGERFRGGLEIV